MSTKIKEAIETRYTNELTTAYEVMFRDYKDIVTTKECADMLRVSQSTVRRMVKEKKLKGLSLPGKLLVVKKSVIDYCMIYNAV